MDSFSLFNKKTFEFLLSSRKLLTVSRVFVSKCLSFFQIIGRLRDLLKTLGCTVQQRDNMVLKSLELVGSWGD